ncbi:MAG TPA: Uma2 family endonuclease [Candidatus Elarobacter sp.]|nr:Uma2 family endonuclease [Candidatus Elarobacter sp.]
MARLKDKDDLTYWGLLDAIRRRHPAYDLEVRNGEYVVVPPARDLIAAALGVNIGSRIERWIEETRMGHVVGCKAGVSYADGDLVAANVTYVSRGRMPVVPRSFARVVPELVFEIRSTSQSERACRAKLQLFLGQGVDVVVFIDPGKREWEVHRANTEPAVLRDTDRFEVPDILPGFSALVDELWPE